MLLLLYWLWGFDDFEASGLSAFGVYGLGLGSLGF